MQASGYLASIQALIEDDSYWPNVHLVGYFGGLLAHHKALRRQIPVSHTITTSDWNSAQFSKWKVKVNSNINIYIKSLSL